MRSLSMSAPRVVCLIAVLMCTGCRAAVATSAEFPEAADPGTIEWAGGCQTFGCSFPELLEACERREGVTFLCDREPERDHDAVLSGRFTACFATKPGKHGIDSLGSLAIVRQLLLRSRAKTDHDLMIDREPLPGTKTYRIYRLARA